MRDDSQDTKSIKEYLIEKNKNLISDTVSAFKEPTKIANGVLESLKPQNLMKNFSAISGVAPILSSIDNKLSDIDDNFTKFIFRQTQNRKNDFLKEAQTDKEISLQEKNNELLAGILKKEGVGPQKEDKKSGGILKTMLGAIMGGGAGVGLDGLVSKAGGGLKKFGKIALKGLGKVALPLAALLAAKDFAEGFGNALEITGRDDFSAKMQAGLSSAVSALTFGLIDAKTISKSLDKAQDAIFGFILNPIQTIKDFADKFQLVEVLDDALNTLSFGLVNIKSISEGIDSFKQFVVKLFTNPIESIKSIVAGYLNIADIVNNVLSNITFGLIPEGVFKDGILKITGFLNDFLIEPFMKIKTWFDEIDIKGFVGRMIDPLVSLKNSIFTGDIFSPLTDWFANFDIVEMLGIGPLLQKVKAFKESITNILSSPKKFISSFFDDEKDKDVMTVRRPSRKITPRNEKNPNYRSTTDEIQESYMKRSSRRRNIQSETNTQTIINTNHSNNIIRDDMSIQTSDVEFGLYAY